MSNFLPVNQLENTSRLIAFFHPQPAYPFHVLVVPKVEIQSMMDLSPAHNLFLSECFATIQKIVKQYDLETPGYRVVINGGKNQDFSLLHFHLISEKSL
ncbi:MAG: HIT domain-containing protein [Anaerolineaceae bacterium]|nr:HIT domain-containing protein [Anaerolineaceae bacterium]